MATRIARYEVTESDSYGQITDRRAFGPEQLADAQQYRRDHSQSTGWTWYRSAKGGESYEVGLHAEHG